MDCCCGKLEERVNEMFETNQIIEKEICWANLQYQRSAGCCQVQGNGALVLTTDLLWFNMLCPNRQIAIPLRSILAVGVASGLIVDFVDPASGMEDQVLFSLRQPQLWKIVIEAVKGNYFGELERRISQRFVEKQIIAKEIFWTNLQFQRSLGPHQVLGNGALVLTPDMLWFTLLLPDKQIEILLQNIRAVEVHTQKRRTPLLVITFVDATTAHEDQVMFTSKDPQSWKRMIDAETIQGGQNPL